MNPQDEQHEKAWRERRADETRSMMRATTRYLMQVLVTVRDGKEERKEWTSISASGGTPYLYDSEDEAEHMLRMCYPDLLHTERRVIVAPGYECLPSGMKYTPPADGLCTGNPKGKYSIGTRAVVWREMSYRVVCATCECGGERRYKYRTEAMRAAIAQSGNPCSQCGAK